MPRLPLRLALLEVVLAAVVSVDSPATAMPALKAPVPAPVVAPSAVGSGVQAVYSLVYTIKTAIDERAPKAVYGSCFVVGVDGLVATNFHVVSSALQAPEKYRLFFSDGDQTLAAEVVAFDAVNDLALVKVPRVFPATVRLAARLPETGAKIYSLGWPEDLNKSVIEGNFNGLVTAGPYAKLQMSIPLNSGMSGGPTIDADGGVIGVNDSIRIDAQSLAFAVPVSSLTALLARPRGIFGRAAPGGAAAVDAEIHGQLDQVQDLLAALLLREQPGTVAMGGWLADKPTQAVKCWRSQENGPRDLSTSTIEHCYLPASAPVRPDAETGTFHVKYRAIESDKLTPWQFLGQVDEAASGFAFGLAEALDRFTTRFKCSEMDLLNAHKVPLRVHYCVNAYVRYPELYNIEVEAVTLTPGPTALLVGTSLLGFSSRNGVEVTRVLLDGIRPEAP